MLEIIRILIVIELFFHLHETNVQQDNPGYPGHTCAFFIEFHGAVIFGKAPEKSALFTLTETKNPRVRLDNLVNPNTLSKITPGVI